MKGLILSGGKGTRLAPFTHTQAKQLVPVANKPVLRYAIDALAQAGVTEIGIIISPETGAAIKEAVGDPLDLDIEFIEQHAPLGLAHALLVAEEWIDGEDVVMYLGDNLLADNLNVLLDSFNRERPDAMILLTPVADPEQFGVAEVDPTTGVVRRLVEKPAEPISDLALVGVYIFSPTVFPYAKQLAPSGRGELEITEAIQAMIDGGCRVESRHVMGWWKDTGQPADLLAANRLILDQNDELPISEFGEDVTIEGRVVIEAGVVIEDSLVRGPAHIASGALIQGSYIGPYTSIGSDAKVVGAEVENSILMSRAVVISPDMLISDSILGRGAKLLRKTGKRKSVNFVIGDASEILVP